MKDNDLEIAAKEYATDTMPFGDETYVDSGAYHGFIAGAEWQKKQLLKGSPLPEDTVLFQKGVEEGKRLMMEDAVEVDVADLNGEIYNNCIEKGMTDEDKVKIVIVKEDDRPRD